MGLPITSYDGYELGTFNETDKQNTDTYSISYINTWYGGITERKNNRTDFVISREINFQSLRQAIYLRLTSINAGDDFAKRPATIGENEVSYHLRGSENVGISTNMLGEFSTDVAGNPQILSAINEISIVTTVDRYAYSAPPEMKLQAGVEYAVWLNRQPIGSNRANALVRSGAASFLDPYRLRGV